MRRAKNTIDRRVRSVSAVYDDVADQGALLLHTVGILSVNSTQTGVESGGRFGLFSNDSARDFVDNFIDDFFLVPLCF